MKVIYSWGTVYEYISNASIISNIHKINIGFKELHYNEYRLCSSRDKVLFEAKIEYKRENYQEIDRIMRKKSLGDILTLLVKNSKNVTEIFDSPPPDSVTIPNFRYYTITKSFGHSKISISFLRLALLKIRDHILLYKVKRIVVPSILFEARDRYIWSILIIFMLEIFSNIDVEIIFLYNILPIH